MRLRFAVFAALQVQGLRDLVAYRLRIGCVLVRARLRMMYQNPRKINVFNTLERNRTLEVEGSIPFGSTCNFNKLAFSQLNDSA